MKYKLREGKEVKVHKKLPKGWKVQKGTLTQPVGTVWITNNNPLFVKGKDGKMHKNPKHKSELCVQNEELMITRIAENRRYNKGNSSDFILDQKTEKRVRAEMNRQTRAQKAWEREREKRIKKVAKTTAAKKPIVKKSKKK